MTSTRYIPNSWGTLGASYHVDQNHPFASDRNPGTPERPFKSISAAAASVDHGDHVWIAEGTYREEVFLPRNGHLYQPESLITFQAMPGHQVYLKGSDRFDPHWREASAGVYEADLPEQLFRAGAYNPYVLALDPSEADCVRPCPGPALPETRGQVFADERPLEQVDGVDAVRQTPGSFIVSASGRRLLVHLPEGRHPRDAVIELTVRARCFRTGFPGTVFIQTMEIVAEHAAEPGAFSRCRACSLRRNPTTGIHVRKTFNMPGTSARDCALLGGLSYVGCDRPTLAAAILDDTRPNPSHRTPVLDVRSDDGGRTWRTLGSVPAGSRSPCQYFLDEQHDLLLRHYRRPRQGGGAGSDSERPRFSTFLEISSDQGQTWGAPSSLGDDRVFFRMLKLQSGELLWLFTEYAHPLLSSHGCMGTLRGQWNPDATAIRWQQGGSLAIDPLKSFGGLAEPQACELPDGRIFVLLRAGNVLASQDHPGVPSVKLWSVSSDRGDHWSSPEPLTYEDGRYVYSPRSYQDLVLSTKNGRLYAVMNILDAPSHMCDPRSTLQIAEIDTETLCVRRGTVTVIETRLEEHHELVRFSNFAMAEDRTSRNLLLFMKLHMAESCFVRYGYDHSLYRYEISLPD